MHKQICPIKGVGAYSAATVGIYNEAFHSFRGMLALLTGDPHVLESGVCLVYHRAPRLEGIGAHSRNHPMALTLPQKVTKVCSHGPASGESQSSSSNTQWPKPTMPRPRFMVCMGAASCSTCQLVVAKEFPDACYAEWPARRINTGKEKSSHIIDHGKGPSDAL